MQTLTLNNKTYHVYSEDEMGQLNIFDFEAMYSNAAEDLTLVTDDDWEDNEVDPIGLEIANALSLVEVWFAFIEVK